MQITKEKNILEELLLDDKRELYEQLFAIDNSIPQTIESVLIELKNFNPTLFAFWQREGLKPKLTTYLLHYVIPFKELLQSEKKSDTKLLTALLLSCFAWRTFDNCIDGHESNKTAHAVSLQSCLQLIDYSQTNFSVNAINAIQSHYSIMTTQSLRETEMPIELNDIWKRCSIFLFAPETLAELNEKNISIYKNYINYTGLAHDITDLISDISGGIISLPLFWLRENNPFNLLNEQSVKNMNEKARVSVKPIEKFFNSIDVQNNYPLFSHLINISQNIINDSSK